MAQQQTTTAPRDIIAQDGSAMRRGYLEIIMEAQDPAIVTTALTTPVTLGLLDQHSRLERMVDHRSFPSNIPIELDRNVRRKVAVALMDRLTERLGVSAFTDELEDFHEQLEQFAHYLQDTSVEVIAASANAQTA